MKRTISVLLLVAVVAAAGCGESEEFPVLENVVKQAVEAAMTGTPDEVADQIQAANEEAASDEAREELQRLSSMASEELASLSDRWRDHRGRYLPEGQRAVQEGRVALMREAIPQMATVFGAYEEESSLVEVFDQIPILHRIKRAFHLSE